MYKHRGLNNPSNVNTKLLSGSQLVKEAKLLGIVILPKETMLCGSIDSVNACICENVELILSNND